MNRIDILLDRMRRGDDAARNELFACVHSELHAIARAVMAGQGAAHTLQPTALVNELFVKLGCGDVQSLSDRSHFLRLAANAMRQILVDHARHKAALRREEPCPRSDFDELVVEYDQRSGGLVRLDEALAKLERRDPELAQIVELRFFAGRSMEEVARLLGSSTRTVTRRWDVARAYLRGELNA